MLRAYFWAFRAYLGLFGSYPGKFRGLMEAYLGVMKAYFGAFGTYVKFVAPIPAQICLEYLGPLGHIPGDWRPIWGTGGLNLKSVFLF